jgi:trans-aconitate 2-methyltransferase
VSSWDPDQYHRFAAERRQPFDDLAALVTAVPGGRVVDLGCGSGELTEELHSLLRATETLGVDSSPTMLQEAQAHAGDGLTFRLADAAAWQEPGWDVIFANASLQWMADHRPLLERLRGLLAPGGQLAFQVPANFDHPSHVVAAEVAGEEPFASELGNAFGPGPGGNVLDPVDYAVIVHGVGALEQHVRLQVYGHQLASGTEVVEWVKGTALTRYRDALSPGSYQAFLRRYQERLLEHLGGDGPYFYPFKRILVWARFR